MQGTNKVVIGGVILVFIVVGTFVAVKAVKKVTRSTAPATEITTSPAASPSAATVQNMVTILVSGFSPQTITIKAGDSITWINSDSANHTVNSDPHPVHSLYPILNQVSMIQAGEKKSLTFTTAGQYTYHDHLNPQLTGTVIVK